MYPAAITDEISPDFECALDVLAEFGVRRAELRGLWGTGILDLDADQRHRARKALLRRGMSVCGLASPVFKCDLPGEGEPLPRAAWERLERAIELARYFDTKLIRIFAFRNRGPLTGELFARIVAALRPAARMAEQAGVVLGLENEHACNLGTGREAGRALAEVDSPALRAVWDPGNAWFAGEAAPYPEGYEAVRPFLAHVHVKDTGRDAGGRPEWVPLGEGAIDYRGQLAALAADGYRGALSLETHWRAPSGTAEESSRRCLETLLKMLREIA